MMLPGLVPAFENYWVSWAIYPIARRSKGSFKEFLCLAWSLLQDLRERDQLARACEMVRNYFLGDWTLRMLRCSPADQSDPLLDQLDSVVVEWALVGLAMLGVGYALSSLAPFLFGAVRDATGSFTAVLWLIVATAGLLALASMRAPHRRAQPDAQSVFRIQTAVSTYSSDRCWRLPSPRPLAAASL